jgi:hypothetical protein
VRRLVIACSLLLARAAFAEIPVGEELHFVEQSRTWPLQVGLSALVGVEPQSRANGAPPIAFGVSAELLWKARLGGFVSLLSSEGTLVLVTDLVNNMKVPSLPDRISVPFGLATRPFMWWRRLAERDDFAARLAQGLGVQAGVAVENLRTSDDSTTVAGLHLGLSLDVPLWGSPRQGGAAIRVAGRGMITPTVTLSAGTVSEPSVSGQLYAGFTWWP